MRFDSIGMFWEDKPSTRKTKPEDRPMPKIPPSKWEPPKSLPDLSDAVCIALDTETYDPGLKKFGPGWARKAGHVVGVSIAAVNKAGYSGCWYFPVRHETMTEHNLNPAEVFAWLNKVLANDKVPKIGANLQYDYGWLRHEGVEVQGELIDVQYAEALLDEAAPVALEDLGQKYLGMGKESPELYQWLADWFGGNPTPDQRKWIYKAPPCLVGPYAESDADLPLKLGKVLWPLLVKERLVDLFSMECRLIRLMVDMRWQGVSVDVDKAERLKDTLTERADAIQKELNRKVGFDVNVNAAESLAAAFTELGLPFKKTTKGNPSFTKQFLESVEHPVGDLIREIRKCEKLKGTFVESYILDSAIDGKVYGSFHQLRGEGGGTRSGRFSSSAPNLQNIPSRDEELAPLIRGLFIPDKGHVAWRKYDYSQIEYRLLLQFAVGQAGEEIRAYFRKHPKTDYHVYAQEIVKQATGILIDRKPIKNINFGLIYGMGVPTLAASLKMPVPEAKRLMEAYFKGVPFAKPTMDAAMQHAQKLGVIETIMGRKSRFDLWEPSSWQDQRPALPYKKAIQIYGGNIQRAYTHKALNRKLQGSAADLMKMAMLRCYEDGVFDHIGVPRLTVHDELDFSDFGGVDDGYLEMKRIMETALPLDVPILADGEIGPDWGHVKDIVT